MDDQRKEEKMEKEVRYSGSYIMVRSYYNRKKMGFEHVGFLYFNLFVCRFVFLWNGNWTVHNGRHVETSLVSYHEDSCLTTIIYILNNVFNYKF